MICPIVICTSCTIAEYPDGPINAMSAISTVTFSAAVARESNRYGSTGVWRLPARQHDIFGTARRSDAHHHVSGLRERFDLAREHT